MAELLIFFDFVRCFFAKKGHFQLYQLCNATLSKSFSFSQKPQLIPVPYGSAPALILSSWFPEKKQKKLKWKKESEQLRMLGLPGCLLNNLMSLSLNSYVVFIVWIKGSWFVNYEPISWSHKPKLCKTSSFHQLFFQNIFLKWLVQTIFVRLSRFKNERD